MTQFEDVLETILEEYARRDSEGEFDTWEETDAFVKEKAEILLAYVKEEPVSEELEEAAKHYLYSNILYDDVYVGNPTDKDCIEMFKAGTKWQKQQMKVVFVITRCEEHSDYVEEVFLDESKAKEYCKKFEGNEDAYARHITKIEVTL